MVYLKQYKFMDDGCREITHIRLKNNNKKEVNTPTSPQQLLGLQFLLLCFFFLFSVV